MLDKSYYQLRKYFSANFKCPLDAPNIKNAIEALDACNFIAAYQEIGKMLSGNRQSALVSGMDIKNDPVLAIKLRACKRVVSLAEDSEEAMEFALHKNLDFACCSRSSYGNCLISLLANIVPTEHGKEVLETILLLSKAIYRSDYDKNRIQKEFPQAAQFMDECVDNGLLEKVQDDACILENEWK